MSLQTPQLQPPSQPQIPARPSVVAPHSARRRLSTLIRPATFSTARGSNAGLGSSDNLDSATEAPSAVSGAVPATQEHPTSLPVELLSIVRAFRATVEHVASNPSLPVEVSRDLQRGCSDLLRYVSSFLVAKQTEAVAAEERCSMGWGAAAISAPVGAVSPELIGPFILSTMYCILDCMIGIVHCDRASVFMLDSRRRQLVSVVVAGNAAPMAPIRIPYNHGIAGAVFASGIAVSMANSERVPASVFSRDTDNKTGFYTRSLLAFPLFARRPQPLVHTPDAACEPPTPARAVDAPEERQVVGVVELLNRMHRGNDGFTEQDETALHHCAELLSSICDWGSIADLTSPAGLEESMKLQQLVIGQRLARRVALRTNSNAGSKQLTITEARSKHAKQRDVEERVEKQAEGLACPQLGGEFDRSPFILAMKAAVKTMANGAATLVYHVGPRGTMENIPSPLNATQGLNARDDDAKGVRDVALVLERVELSWKLSRGALPRPRGSPR